MAKTPFSLRIKDAFNTIIGKSNANALVNVLQPLDGEPYTFDFIGNQFLSKRDLEIDAYGSTGIVFLVIDKIASKIKSLPYELVAQGSGDEVRELSEDELNKIFDLADCNKEEFLYSIATNLLVGGEFFIVKNRAIGFETASSVFNPINSDVTINEDGHGNVKNYNISYKGYSYLKDPSDVLHVKRPDITKQLGNNRGFSSLQALRFDWQASKSISQNDQFIHESHGANAIIHPVDPKVETPQQREATQKEIDKVVNSKGRVGKLAWLPQQVGQIPLGIKPKDMNSVEAQNAYIRFISAAYNVPSQLINDQASSTYNNMIEAKKAFILDAVLPVARQIINAINDWLVQGELNQVLNKIVINEDAIKELNEINKDLSDKLIAEIGAGLLTPNEAREILYPNLESIEAEIEGTTEKTDTGLEDNPQAENTNDIAQANLRGSVGGVQGILAIQASVSQGITDYQAAVETLTIIYGFTPEQARAVLGSPKNINSNTNED